MDQTISRYDAAHQQLICGLTCYERGEFIAAITLGAAAEELLNKELPSREPHRTTAWEQDKNVLEFFHSGDVTESKPGEKDSPVRKAAGNLLASVRNFLKHGNSETFAFDPEFEAADRLQRSVDTVYWMTGDPALRDDWNRRIRFLHKKK